MKKCLPRVPGDGCCSTFLVEGYGVRVCWDSPEVEPVIDGLGFLCSPVSEPSLLIEVRKRQAGYRLYVDGLSFANCSAESLPSSLERKIQLEVATHAPNRVFVHCGVVRYRGQAILFPGKSFCGKSSLVFSFCEAGALYYSDEYAVIDSDGKVRPWPRPIALRGESQGAVTKRIEASALGWRPEFGPVWTRLVVFTSFQEGALWRPKSLSPGVALMGLLDNTVSARSEPKRALGFLAALLKGAQCVRSKRGEACEVTRAIIRAL